MINGNTQGIRQALLSQMEAMQEIECDRDVFVPEELMQEMARFTGLLNREISVYLSRSGSVLDVTVGDAETVGLPEVTSAARSRASRACAAFTPILAETARSPTWTCNPCSG